MPIKIVKKTDKQKTKKTAFSDIKSIQKKIVKVKRKVSKPTKEKEADKNKFELYRSEANPIIEPSDNFWESRATFNPAAIFANDKVHIVYRAVGEDDISVLGYAISKDGFTIDERIKHPIYNRFPGKPHFNEASITYGSGGGWNGGCEDPRLALVEGIIYVIYTAFDGWNSLRLALTSISLKDFENRKWNWKKPVIISPPGEIHKNWVMFPEKINGKFAILHSISPEILVDYVEDMNEFDGNKFIKSCFFSKSPRKNSWDNLVRGVGPTPIKTKDGWLVLYHAMDCRDPNKYKLGGMLLDLNDPTKVLYRSKSPILEPNECYENEGFKAGVVYSCGAVVIDKKLVVYYGGADKVVCVASCELDKLITNLKSDRAVNLKKETVSKKSK